MRKRKKPHLLFEYLKRANRKFRKAINRTRPSRGMKEKAMNMAVYFSSLWPRRDCVKSQSSNVLMRVGLATLVVVSSIVLLTACGGGGGGGTTTPTPPVVVTPPVTPVASGSVKAEPTTCNALAGTDSCTVMVTAEAKNAPNAVLITPTGQTNVANTTITVSVAVKLGVSRLEVKEGQTVLADASVTATCATGLVVQGTTCMKPTATGTLSVPQTVIANDASTAAVVVSFTSNHTSALSVTLGSETKTVPAGSGEVTFTRTGVNDLPVSLKDNGTQIASGVSKASCNSGAAWDTPWTKCRVILPSYNDYVVGIWGIDGVPYIVNKAGATLAINKTPWQLPTAGLFFCGLRKVNNPDSWGYVHGSCQDNLTLKERPFMINPQTGELTLSSPIDPYSPEYVVGNPVDYRYADVYDPAYPDWSTKARVVDGWFYNPGAGGDDSPIRFRRDDMSDVLIMPGTISANGNVKLLQTFRHTKP
jgi:hypothetical protein